MSVSDNPKVSGNFGTSSAAVILDLFGVQRTAKYYGFKHDGSDEGALMNTAMQDLYTRTNGHGGKLLMPDGKTTTIATQVSWLPGVTVESESGNVGFVETTATWYGHMFKHADTFTNSGTATASYDTSKAMFITDNTLGEVRQNSSISGVQRYHGGSMRGLMFKGNTNSSQHTTECDLLHLHRSWGITMRDIMLFQCRGFGMRLLDLNVLTLDKVRAIGAPIWGYSNADCQWNLVQSGGGNGTVATPMWIGEDCSKNIFVNTMGYNNNGNGYVMLTQRNYAYPVVLSAVSTADGILTCATNAVYGDAAHKLTTGMPVIMESTGSLPTGFLPDKTYYVRRIGGTILQLCSTLAGAIAGTGIVVPSTVGSGTIQLRVGANANIYVNDNATNNKFFGGRSDQAHGAGIIVGRAPNNSFGSFMLNENCFGNYVGYVGGWQSAAVAPTPQAAIQIRNNSTGCNVTDTLVNGAKYGVLNDASGNESRQLKGIDIDASSRLGTPPLATLTSINHTVANSAAGAANFASPELNPNLKQLDATQFWPVGGTATRATYGGGRWNGISFPDAADNSAEVFLDIPFGWTNVDITLYGVPGGTSSGNVALFIELAGHSVGTTTAAAGTVTAGPTAFAAGAVADVVMSATFSNVDVSSLQGKRVRLKPKRPAATSSALDTNTDAWVMLGADIAKIA